MFIKTEKGEIINSEQYRDFGIKTKPPTSGKVRETFAVIAVNDDNCREIISFLDKKSAQKVLDEIFLHMQANAKTLDVNIFIDENGRLKI